MTTPSLGEVPLILGAKFNAVIFPAFKLQYQDKEPGDRPQTGDEITGLVTNVPKLGSMLQVAWIGEEINIANNGAEQGVHDWGDGTTSGTPAFTHTYNTPGVYWIQNKSSAGTSALAARMVKAVYKDTAPAYGSLADHHYCVPFTLDEIIEGGVETPFSFKGYLTLGLVNPEDGSQGWLEEGSGIVIMADRYVNNQLDPTPYIVAGGFITNRTIEDYGTYARISFVAQDITYWMAQQTMREQQYTDPNIMGIGFAKDMAMNFFKGVDQLLQKDPFGIGYNPSHAINVQVEEVTAHIIQHLHVTAPGMPAMYNKPAPSNFGNLGQLTNIYTEPEFVEGGGSDGFHAFSIPNGNPVNNIRTALSNEGGYFCSRSDMTLHMKRKPWYKITPDTPVMDIYVPYAEAPIAISSGAPPNIWKVQVERAPLSNLGPADTQQPTAPIVTGGPPVKPSEIVTTPEFPGTGIVGSGPPITRDDLGNWAKNANDTAADDSTNYVEQVQDSMTMSVDINTVLYTYVCGEEGGAIIGPLRHVFSIDLPHFAKGVANEKLSHWRAEIPLGDFYRVDAGDVVTLTYRRDTGMQVNWVSKHFWVIGVKIGLPKMSKLTKQLTLIEIDPADQTTYDPTRH